MSMLAFGKSRQTFFARFSGRRALRPRKVVVGCRSPHFWQTQVHPHISALLALDTTWGRQWTSRCSMEVPVPFRSSVNDVFNHIEWIHL